VIVLTALVASVAAATPAHAAEYTDCNKETSQDGGGNGVAVCTLCVPKTRFGMDAGSGRRNLAA
jgi:hypothetical protein